MKAGRTANKGRGVMIGCMAVAYRASGERTVRRHVATIDHLV
jgi:hypothetical protein